MRAHSFKLDGIKRTEGKKHLSLRGTLGYNRSTKRRYGGRYEEK